MEEILLNACTYSKEGDAVRVEVQGGDEQVLLRVTDPGVGIPLEELSKVFDAGFVGSNQVPDAEGGSGMGLALAQRVVNTHGGTIWIESQTGRGTQISLTLPRAS